MPIKIKRPAAEARQDVFATFNPDNLIVNPSKDNVRRVDKNGKPFEMFTGKSSKVNAMIYLSELSDLQDKHPEKGIFVDDMGNVVAVGKEAILNTEVHLIGRAKAGLNIA